MHLLSLAASLTIILPRMGTPRSRSTDTALLTLLYLYSNQYTYNYTYHAAIK
jgi:hypothetical protein